MPANPMIFVSPRVPAEAAPAPLPASLPKKVPMILVAGPYRSGTGDDPALIRANMKRMEEAALALFRGGVLGVTGEALALPLIATAGGGRLGDAVWDAIFHPVAERLVPHCDACLRIGGPSEGADRMVALFRAMGRPVYRSVEEALAGRAVP
ncbi:MAG TPA: hypothetical protein VEB20_18715 [Azospirillaceae bacterium]|nr:hypothetical protein [Azospirillaceae bacterium]